MRRQNPWLFMLGCKPVDALERAVEGPTERRRDVLNLPVLLLNRFFAPVSVTTVRRAFVLLYGGVGHAVDVAGDTYDFADWRSQPVRSADDALPIVGGALRVPRVLHLLRYERTPRAAVRLTRNNLMLRCAPISSLLEIGTQVRKSGLINPTCGVRLSKHCAGRMLRDALLRNAPQHEDERLPTL